MTRLAENIFANDWRIVTEHEKDSIKALPKNDETVEWWNGQAWDLVPTLHLD